MPSMEMATDHYDISYIISGDREVITPLQSFSYHAGDVAFGAPYVYHKTISQSDAPYENYIIKYTLEFIEPFFENIEKSTFDKINEERVCRFSPPVQLEIKQLFSDILDEYEKKQPYSEIILQGMLCRLLTIICKKKHSIEAVKYKSMLTESVIETIYYIENNYSKRLTLEEMAKKVHFSSFYFSRIFSEQLGMSFSEYVSNVRIKHVKDMLIQTDKSIMRIALDTGYCSGDYLSTQFKNKTGMTPSQFRRSIKKSTG